MAQIFVSHSSKDAKPIDFVNRAFASTNVSAKYEEIEAIVSGRRTAEEIRIDIQQSNAVFVLLGEHVEAQKHTRDWVAWESGVAANKDVWVFEAAEDTGRISVVIPRIQHLVRFQYSDPWLAYIRSIISSYDDSHLLKAAIAGAGTGAAFAAKKDTGMGVILGAGAGLVLAAMNSQTRPSGLPVLCPACRSFYSVHLCEPAMRCPVCNVHLVFPAQ